MAVAQSEATGILRLMPFAPSGTIELFYDATGDPADTPVVLVAGLGQQVIGWELLAVEDLAERGHYVIRFDNRDVGLSSKLHGELVRGVVSDDSKQAYPEIIGKANDCDAVIAGCTEIELLIGPDDLDVAYFPTARIHALAAVDFALS